MPALDHFTHSGFFVLRTPLLPVEEFLKLSDPGADGDRAHTFPGDNRSLLRSRLRAWAERPEVREALWLASPDLVQSLAGWQEDPANAKSQKLEQTLYRYFARMTARATPFGAFAGCSLGRVSNETRLELSGRSRYRRSTRLDMEYLYNLAKKLSADPLHRDAIRFRCNSSLHLAAGKYHHLRGELYEGCSFFHLVATDPTPALDATLTRAASGATAKTLAEALIESDPEIALEDAHAFVACLIETQLLVSELAPPVTGTDPLVHIIGQMEEAGATLLAEDLRSLAVRLREFDSNGLGANLGGYDEISASASRLGEFTAGRLVQVDVMKPVEAATINRELVDQILGAVQTLFSIRSDSTQTAYQSFIDQFQERYQEDEVPLLEALDDEAGIGFESEDNPTSEPLLAGIDFCAKEPAQSSEGAKETPLLTRRLQELQENRATILELDATLIEELKVAEPLPLPDAFYVMGAVLPASADKRGFYLQNVCGPSGANLLARFCYMDEQLSESVKKHIQREESLHSANAVFAEVAHLPEGRVGNVVYRPVLRQYEIPFLATSGVPAEQQIPLPDLTVSVCAGRIVLRSRRLDREVIPRLTTAHNFVQPRALKLYKFLCLLQHQGTTADLFWNWGPHEQAAVLPRVCMGNIVFSLARWRVNKEIAPRLFLDDNSRQAGCVEEWRQTARVPRFVFIVQADNQLLIDFENALSVETFLDHIRKQKEAILMEMFPAPGSLAVHGPEGTFVHEIIVPFERKAPLKFVAPRKKPADAHETPSLVVTVPALAEGSEWLFAKLYCSPSHADRLLLELVRPLVERVVQGGGASGWFFIRYADPRWHLRLRFRGSRTELQDQVLPLLREMAEPFERQGILWRLQFEAYEREVERYGGPAGLEIAERFFQLDSELCLELLPLITGDASGELRWRLAFAGAESLLSGLGLSLPEKKSLVEQLRNFREEAWILDDNYRKQMAHKFRSGTLRQTLAAILDDLEKRPVQSLELPREALAALTRQFAGLQTIRQQLIALSAAGLLTAPLGELASSYLHMHFNRILRSCHLEQEAVICDLLARSYATRLARHPAEPQSRSTTGRPGLDQI